MGINLLAGNQTPLSVAPEAGVKPQASGEQTSDLPVTDGHIYGNEGPIGKRVPVGELESYIARMAKRKKGLEDEFMVGSPQCLSERLQYLKCVSNGVTSVLR